MRSWNRMMPKCIYRLKLAITLIFILQFITLLMSVSFLEEKTMPYSRIGFIYPSATTEEVPQSKFPVPTLLDQKVNSAMIQKLHLQLTALPDYLISNWKPHFSLEKVMNLGNQSTSKILMTICLEWS